MTILKLNNPVHAVHPCTTRSITSSPHQEEAPMSWIRETDVAVPSVISCMSINPDLMAAVQNLNASATFGSSALTRTQEEAIATVVSLVNRCRY